MRRRSTGIRVSLGAGALAIALLTVLPGVRAGAEEGQGDTNPKAARELFVDTHRCQTCHSVEAAGISRKSDKIVGADLGGFVTDAPERLAAYLRKEEARDGEDHKKTFKGSDEELQAILDWLGSLEAADE